MSSSVVTGGFPRIAADELALAPLENEPQEDEPQGRGSVSMKKFSQIQDSRRRV